MIQPGVYNIRLQRRADYSVVLEFRDSNKIPIDLTASTVAAQVWDSSRSTKYADFIIEYISRPLGKVRLKLTYADTTALPSESVYDVLVINSFGTRDFYLEGTVTALEGYTAVP